MILIQEIVKNVSITVHVPLMNFAFNVFNQTVISGNYLCVVVSRVIMKIYKENARNVILNVKPVHNLVQTAPNV